MFVLHKSALISLLTFTTTSLPFLQWSLLFTLYVKTVSAGKYTNAAFLVMLRLYAGDAEKLGKRIFLVLKRVFFVCVTGNWTFGTF